MGHFDAVTTTCVSVCEFLRLSEVDRLRNTAECLSVVDEKLPCDVGGQDWARTISGDV